MTTSLRFKVLGLLAYIVLSTAAVVLPHEQQLTPLVVGGTFG